MDGFSRARTRVFFSGTAAQVGDAFHTELHRYLVNGEIEFRECHRDLRSAAAFGHGAQCPRSETFRRRPGRA